MKIIIPIFKEKDFISHCCDSIKPQALLTDSWWWTARICQGWFFHWGSWKYILMFIWGNFVKGKASLFKYSFSWRKIKNSCVSYEIHEKHAQKILSRWAASSRTRIIEFPFSGSPINRAMVPLLGNIPNVRQNEDSVSEACLTGYTQASKWDNQIFQI